MSDITDYLELGVGLTNKNTNLRETFKDWPKDRSVVLRVCRPHPEVEAQIKGWLQLYAEDRLMDGAVAEELFVIGLDTSGEKYEISYSDQPTGLETTQVFVSEAIFWDLAARTNTLYSVFITGKPIWVKSAEGMDLRDLGHMDKILTVIHENLNREGINLAGVVRG
jgi:hypothetical protein